MSELVSTYFVCPNGIEFRPPGTRFHKDSTVSLLWEKTGELPGFTNSALLTSRCSGLALFFHFSGPPLDEEPMLIGLDDESSRWPIFSGFAGCWLMTFQRQRPNRKVQSAEKWPLASFCNGYADSGSTARPKSNNNKYTRSKANTIWPFQEGVLAAKS